MLQLKHMDQRSRCFCESYVAELRYANSQLINSSFDMTSLPCGSAGDAQFIANLVLQYAAHPNQAMYNNRILVSIWDGAYCQFGQGSVVAGWNYFRTLIRSGGREIYIMPSIFVGTQTFNTSQNWFDGHFDWDNSWPLGATDLDGSRDIEQVTQLRAINKGYMAGVSPNFFTYYAPNSYNKNWIYRGDNWLLATRMEQLTQQRGLYDMAEIISWNGASS